MAPLHQPHNLAPIRALAGMRPDCRRSPASTPPSTPPWRMRRPLSPSRPGSARSCAATASTASPTSSSPSDCMRWRRRLPAAGSIVAHLGNGASLCALRGGRSMDTTMGFTALDGLVMGTRPGRLDPGVVPYLIREKAHPRRSGGGDAVSPLGPARRCQAFPPTCGPCSPHPNRARLGRCGCSPPGWCARRADWWPRLGGLDALVFTGGIGEHAATIRADACARLDWLGVRLDDDANAAGRTRISAEDSRVAVLVIPTDEEAMIAHHVEEVLEAAP